MKKLFTRLLAVTLLLLLSVWSVNAQTTTYSGTFPITGQGLAQIFTNPVAAGWAGSTSSPTATDRSGKCFASAATDCNFNSGRNVTYRLPNCGTLTLQVNGTLGRGFIITVKKVSDGTQISRTVWAYPTALCSTQDFVINQNIPVNVVISSPTATEGAITVTGSSYISYMNITSACISPSISSVTAPSSSICASATQTLGTTGVAGTNAVVTWWTGTGGTGTNLGTGTTLPAVGPGTYYARVTADCGSAAEASTTVTASPSTSITTQPVGASYFQFASPTALSVSATGTALTYQWYSNTINSTSGATLLVGQTSSTYTPSTATIAETYYYCVVGGCTSVTSDIVALNVTAAANPTLGLTNGSSTQTINVGSPITNIVYTWAGTATTADATWTGSTVTTPTGISETKDASTITLSGTPAAPGTYNYSIRSTDGSSNYSDPLTGIITVKLATPTVSSPTSATNQGFTANWSDISGESGYTVKVYQGASLISTITGIAADATTQVVTGLSANTTYTVTVTGIGDGSLVPNSNESTASASVRTLSTAKAITVFNITSQISSSVNEGAKTITVLVPYGTDKSSLTPNTITASGLASVDPGTGTPQNFTSPINYTVTAEDGSQQIYAVSIDFGSLATDYFRSKASGNWSDVATWESSPDNSNWISATSTPGTTASTVTIQSTNTVTVISAITANNTTVNSGAKLAVNTGGTFTINSAKTLTIDGTLENGVKSATNPISGTVVVNGTFNLTAAPTGSTASDATFIPTATWGIGSTCKISGIVGTLETDYTVLNGVNQAFYNFEVNTPNLIGKLGLQNVAIFGSANTFTVNSTGPGTGAAIKTGLQTSNSTTGRTGTSVTNYVQNAGTVHIVSNSSSTVGRSFTATGNFTLNGGTFNIAEYTGSSAVSTSLTIGGNLTVGTGAILQKDLTTALSADQGTVSLIFDGNTVLSNAGTIRDIDVIVVNGTKTLDFGTSIIGSIASSHNSNTVFSTNSGSIIKTAAAGGINSNITTGGIPSLNSATNYIFNGSVAQVSGTLLTSASAITVNNSVGLTLSANTTAATLTNNSGSVLNIPAGKQLTVSTTLTNDGTLNLLSDATGTATILTPSSISGAGTTNVQQYLTLGRNWYISSPVTGATSAAITGTTGSTMVSYNEVNGLWPSAGETLNVGQGYIAVSPTSSAAVTFSGTLNTGAQSFSLNRTDTAVVKRGFNLVGNPYPSYLNWESATRTSVGPTMWYRSKDAGAYVFATYGAVSQLGTSLGGIPVTKYIPPMQAFWVRVSGAGSGTLAFDNSMLSHSATSNLLKAPSATAATQQVLRLQVSNGINNDEAIVFFNENAANGFDAYDSPKMTNANAAIPEIYTMAGNEQLVINGLTSVTPNEELALGFTTGQSNTFTIKATEFSNFSADTKVYLRDNLLNTEQELTSGSEYSFSSDIASTSTRFSVIFKSASVTTGLNSSDVRNGIYKNANNQIIINCNTISADASVSVYNSIGQKVQTKRLTSTDTQIGTGLPSGVYMVTVNNAGKSITAKVILN